MLRSPAIPVLGNGLPIQLSSLSFPDKTAQSDLHKIALKPIELNVQKGVVWQVRFSLTIRISVEGTPFKVQRLSHLHDALSQVHKAPGGIWFVAGMTIKNTRHSRKFSAAFRKRSL